MDIACTWTPSSPIDGHQLELFRATGAPSPAPDYELAANGMTEASEGAFTFVAVPLAPRYKIHVYSMREAVRSAPLVLTIETPVETIPPPTGGTITIIP